MHRQLCQNRLRLQSLNQRFIQVLQEFTWISLIADCYTFDTFVTLLVLAQETKLGLDVRMPNAVSVLSCHVCLMLFQMYNFRQNLCISAGISPWTNPLTYKISLSGVSTCYSFVDVA